MEYAESAQVEMNYYSFSLELNRCDVELIKKEIIEQVADIFTKALAKVKFEVFRRSSRSY